MIIGIPKEIFPGERRVAVAIVSKPRRTIVCSDARRRNSVDEQTPVREPPGWILRRWHALQRLASQKRPVLCYVWPWCLCVRACLLLFRFFCMARFFSARAPLPMLPRVVCCVLYVVRYPLMLCCDLIWVVYCVIYFFK